MPALKNTLAGQTRSRFVPKLSHVLVVFQIALLLLILVAAGLLMGTLRNLQSIKLGFNRENLLLVSLNARQAGYQDDAMIRFYDGLLAEFRAIPGVRSATLSNYAMVSNSQNSTNVAIAGQAAPNANTDVLNVGPHFFSTMQIPILLGHEIGEREAAGARLRGCGRGREQVVNYRNGRTVDGCVEFAREYHRFGGRARDRRDAGREAADRREFLLGCRDRRPGCEGLR